MKFNHYFFTIVIIAANFLPVSSMAPVSAVQAGDKSNNEGFELVQDYVTHDQSAKFGKELVAVHDRADDKGKQQIEQALKAHHLTIDDVRKKLSQDACDLLVEDISKKLTHNTTEIREYKSSDEQALGKLVAERAPGQLDEALGVIKKEGNKTYIMYQNDSMVGFLVVSKVDVKYRDAFLVCWLFHNKAFQDGDYKKLFRHAFSSLINAGATRIAYDIYHKRPDIEQTFKLLISLDFKFSKYLRCSRGLLERYTLSGDELKQYQQKSMNENIHVEQEEIPLVFDREKMALDGAYKVEGYWASSEDPLNDSYQGKFPWPKAHEKPWKGKKEFLERLKRIEERGNIYNNYRTGYIIATTSRGYARSRLKPEVFLGSREYEDKKHKVKWPDGYSEHYIGKYNVIPSHEFYDYVMNYKFD